MTGVGIDCGTTLTKYAWAQDDGELLLYSTASVDEPLIIEQVRLYGITAARTVGVGKRPLAPFLTCVRADGDPIADELKLQAGGVRYLLGKQGTPRDEFVVVSVGTGTSYSVCANGAVERLPLGNALGGGFIQGLAATYGIPIVHVAQLASEARPLDVLIRDVVPEKAGSIEGEFVVAHFAKGVASSSPAERCASIISCVAVSIIRDLLLYGMLRPMPRNVVFIGSTVARVLPLRQSLETYATALGMRPIILKDGEYAAAIGALHASRDAAPTT